MPPEQTAPSEVAPVPVLARPTDLPSRLARSLASDGNTPTSDPSGLRLAPTQPCDPVSEKANRAFSSIQEYVKADLQVTVGEYRILGEMNNASVQKYMDLRHTAGTVAKSLADLNDQVRALQPYLDQIGQLESSVEQLEQAAYGLDAYAKRLEMQFKKLERK